jgi:hypothetical protein
MTITEALAEIKTLVKRIDSKRNFIQEYEVRAESMKDPLEKDGGSFSSVASAFQAIDDLEIRLVSLRRAIAVANDETKITVEGVDKSISEWLIWRREVAPKKEQFLHGLAYKLASVRDQLRRQPSTSWNKPMLEQEKLVDIVVNLDEKKLSDDREQLKNILGQLDGQLSVKNATVQIKI